MMHTPAASASASKDVKIRLRGLTKIFETKRGPSSPSTP